MIDQLTRTGSILEFTETGARARGALLNGKDPCLTAETASANFRRRQLDRCQMQTGGCSARVICPARAWSSL